MPIIAGILGGLKLVPRWVWYALAAALAWHFVIGWHKGQIKAHDRTIMEQRDAYWNGRIAAVAKQAADLRQRAETTAANIASKQRTSHEQTLARNAADAGALVVRGPGKAAASDCRPVDHPGTASLSGRQVAATANANAAGSGLPAEDRAVVSWKWLVQRAREHDDLLSEVITAHNADTEQRAAWDKMRAAKP